MGVPLALAGTPCQAEPDAGWTREMERKIEALTRQVEKKQLGGVFHPLNESTNGLGVAASKVYLAKKGVSLGGYGNMVYEDFQSTKDDGTPSTKRNQIDFLRNILYVGYKFTDRTLFNSEIEFEHASTADGGSRGEVSVEFAYIDWHFKPYAGVRAGMILIPVGITNELHEPLLFHGSKRPNVEKNIIPTTWRDNGVGIYGEAGLFTYRAFLTAGLQASSTTASGVEGFGASTGLRGGRSNGAASQIEDMAFSGRIDFNGIPATTVGGSLYSGAAGQNLNDPINGQTLSVPVNMWDVHALLAWKGLDVKALYVQNRIGDVAGLNRANHLTGDESIGTRMFGGYGAVGFDVFSFWETTQSLTPHLRYERYDTQQRVPSGWARNPANSRTEWTFGIDYKPITNIVLKADWQNINNQGGTGIDQFNMAMGFVY